YIIDEVHMLSKSAFNALLKTLEEPPPFVKFIFATTELQKVPETILSRCMRFDLKRMDIKTITDRMAHITACEHITLEPDAATLIARAAEGSMRDGLSLLDQAFVLSRGSVIQTETVRSMLGLSSKDHVFDVLKAVLSGDVVKILSLTDILYENGCDPLLFLKDALDTLYNMICVKANSAALNQGMFTEAEKISLSEITQNISMASLMQVWQILNDRYDKIYKAPFPGQALQVVLMQVCYVAHLPPLSDILSGSAMVYPVEVSPVPAPLASQTSAPALSVTAAPMVSMGTESPIATNVPASFEDLVMFIRDKREPMLYTHMRSDIVLASYGEGHLSFYAKSSAPKNFIVLLKAFLEKHTSMSWVVEDKGVPPPAAQSLHEIEDARYQKKAIEAVDHPLVKDIVKIFPGAKVSAV
ncbi:MAG: hypothetical protein K2X98_06670, partial [Alphaproteobacteria bacterium]|nr:hypothetical protein [Alphaproteobacteria bacterium]